MNDNINMDSAIGNLWAPGQKETWPPPSIIKIMILKLSPPWCVISKELVQQKWIDELWFRKQLSACLFVWSLNYNDLVHLLNSWPPRTITLVLYIGSLTNLATSFPCGRGKTLFILGSKVKVTITINRIFDNRVVST
jgi:hypothetical protein